MKEDRGPGVVWRCLARHNTRGQACPQPTELHPVSLAGPVTRGFCPACGPRDPRRESRVSRSRTRSVSFLRFKGTAWAFTVHTLHALDTLIPPPSDAGACTHAARGRRERESTVEPRKRTPGHRTVHASLTLSALALCLAARSLALLLAAFSRPSRVFVALVHARSQVLASRPPGPAVRSSPSLELVLVDVSPCRPYSMAPLLPLSYHTCLHY